MASSKLASNVYMGSGSSYPTSLTSSRPDMLVSSKSGTTALVSASKAVLTSSKEGAAVLTSTSTTAGTGLGLAKGAGFGTGICKVASAGGLAVTGTIVSAIITGGVGLLVGYLTYRGVKAFVS